LNAFTLRGRLSQRQEAGSTGGEGEEQGCSSREQTDKEEIQTEQGFEVIHHFLGSLKHFGKRLNCQRCRNSSSSHPSGALALAHA